MLPLWGLMYNFISLTPGTSSDPASGKTLALEHARQLYDEKEWRAAAEVCFALLAAESGCGEAWCVLGAALHRLDQWEAAHEALIQALACGDGHAWLRLGGVLTDLRRLDEAAEAFAQALAFDPSCFEAQLNGAILDYVAGRDEAALRGLQAALALVPGDVRALILSVRLALRRRDMLSAETACRELLSAHPTHAEARMLLGRVAYEQGRVEEARTRLEDVVASAPQLAEARNELAVVLQSLGLIDAARVCLREALALDPLLYEAWPTLAALVDGASEPALCHQITGITDTLLADQRRVTGRSDPLVPMHYANGKLLDDLGKHEAALRHFTAGASLRRAALAYDEAEHVAFCEAIKAAYPLGSIAERAVGRDAMAPIFLVGMPRSGSTLIEQLLAGHPDIRALGETTLLCDALTMAQRHDPGVPVWPFVADALSADQSALIAKTYRTAAGAGFDSKRTTDKMLGNFHYLALICRLFPDAKIIHTRRNPLDTCVSAFTTLFSDAMAWSYDLEELGRYYGRYADLMAHWRNVLPEGMMIEVDYEAMVTQPERESRRLLNFLGLSWDDCCLAFARARRPVHTASAVQVRRALYTSSVERWRRYGAGLALLIETLQSCLSNSGSSPLPLYSETPLK